MFLTGPTATGSYAFHPDEVETFLKLILNEDTIRYYWLDVDCLYTEEDVVQILKDCNPV